jgi:RNA polymerase-interacting CarD/CdnL/TRCF family regulator
MFMELWIRSQDRELLLKVDQLYANVNAIKVNEITVAEYTSSKRALEVLDNIQNHVENECIGWKGNGSLEKQSYIVYEMPKE